MIENLYSDSLQLVIISNHFHYSKMYVEVICRWNAPANTGMKKKKCKNALTVPVKMSLGGNSRESEEEGNLVDEGRHKIEYSEAIMWERPPG